MFVYDSVPTARSFSQTQPLLFVQGRDQPWAANERRSHTGGGSSSRTLACPREWLLVQTLQTRPRAHPRMRADAPALLAFVTVTSSPWPGQTSTFQAFQISDWEHSYGYCKVQAPSHTKPIMRASVFQEVHTTISAASTASLVRQRRAGFSLDWQGTESVTVAEQVILLIRFAARRGKCLCRWWGLQRSRWWHGGCPPFRHRCTCPTVGARSALLSGAGSPGSSRRLLEVPPINLLPPRGHKRMANLAGRHHIQWQHNWRQKLRKLRRRAKADHLAPKS